MKKLLIITLILSFILITSISAFEANQVKKVIQGEASKISQGQDTSITSDELKSLLKFYLKDNKQTYTSEDTNVYIQGTETNEEETATIETTISGTGETEIIVNGEERKSVGKILNTADPEIFIEEPSPIIVEEEGEMPTIPEEILPEPQTIEGEDLIWFVTSEKWGVKPFNTPPGSTLGGIEGGIEGIDAQCNKAGKNFRREFKAIISTESIDANDRVPSSGRVVNVLGQVLLEDINDLFPLPNFNDLGVEANLAENAVRTTVPNPGSGVWWGSDLNGVKVTGETCNGWTSGAGTGKQVDIQKGEAQGSHGCQAGSPGHVICLAQSGGTSGWCGDGETQSGYEECDEGILENGKPCTPETGKTCTYCEKDCTEKTLFGNVCGNGIIEGKEQCDDGLVDPLNIQDDGCYNCQWTYSWKNAKPELTIQYLMENSFLNARRNPELYPTSFSFGFVGTSISIGQEIKTPFKIKIYNEENGHVFYEREVSVPLPPSKTFGGSISRSGGTNEDLQELFVEGENRIIFEVDSENVIDENYEYNNKMVVICNKKTPQDTPICPNQINEWMH